MYSLECEFDDEVVNVVVEVEVEVVLAVLGVLAD